MLKCVEPEKCHVNVGIEAVFVLENYNIGIEMFPFKIYYDEKKGITETLFQIIYYTEKKTLYFRKTFLMLMVFL